MQWNKLKIMLLSNLGLMRIVISILLLLVCGLVGHPLLLELLDFIV